MTDDEKNDCGIYTDKGWIVLPLELRSLLAEWRLCPSAVDGQMSGIIADWIEDHRETCVVYASDESIDCVVGWLRKRFSEPFHNHSFFP